MASAAPLFAKSLPDPDPDDLAADRARYEAGEARMEDIAARHGRSQTSMRRIAKEQGWVSPPRKAPPRAARPPVEAPEGEAGAPADSTAILNRLARKALRLMDLLEKQLGAGGVSEQDTRMMASLIRMLSDFRKSGLEGGAETGGVLNGRDGESSADLAADMARARSDLVARLSAAIAAHEAGDVSGGDS